MSIVLTDRRTTGGGIDFAISTKKSSIATPSRSLLATLVLSGSDTDGIPSQCASHSFRTATCAFDRTGRTLSCW